LRLLRANGFAVTAAIGRNGEVREIIDVEEGNTSAQNYAVGVDIGTPTNVAHLLNAVDLATVDVQVWFNSQSLQAGRMTARTWPAKKSWRNLQETLVGDMNRLISVLAVRNKVNLKHVKAVVCSGNGAMMHFLLGLPADNIRRNPFIAATVHPPPFRRCPHCRRQVRNPRRDLGCAEHCP